MNNFQQACEMSCARWLSSLPQSPENHEFSEKHNKEMKKLFIKMRGNKYHRFTKATARAILVAAIILALAATAFAVETRRHYALKPFSNYTEYSVASGKVNKDVDEISLHYIPKECYLSATYDMSDTLLYEYISDSGVRFNVNISEQSGLINFDTENYDCTTAQINGVEYVIFSDGKNYNGVLFNKYGYNIVVDGEIDRDELLVISENIY